MVKVLTNYKYGCVKMRFHQRQQLENKSEKEQEKIDTQQQQLPKQSKNEKSSNQDIRVQNNQTQLEFKTKGNSLFENGNLQGALEAYTQCINCAQGGNEDDVTSAYCNRALVHLRCKQFEYALKDCEEVLKRDGNYYKAIHRKAQALQSLGRIHEAYQEYSQLIQLLPQNQQIQREYASLNQIKEELKGTKNENSKVVHEIYVSQDDNGTLYEDSSKIAPCALLQQKKQQAQDKIDKLYKAQQECSSVIEKIQRQKFVYPKPKNSSELELGLKAASKDDETLKEYILQISPNELATIIQNSLSVSQLGWLGRGLAQCYNTDMEQNFRQNMLEALSQLPRFETTLLMLSKEQKKSFQQMFSSLPQSLQIKFQKLQKI